MIDELLCNLNDDEKFYRAYFESARKPETLKRFLSRVDVDDARRRHLILPALLPENISYQVNHPTPFAQHCASKRQELSVKFGTRPKRLDSLISAPEYPYSLGLVYISLYPVELDAHPITFCFWPLLLCLTDNFYASNAKGT